MTAGSLLQNLTRAKWQHGLFIALCLFPVVTGLSAKLTGHNWIFMDADAVVCAARNVSLSLSPYAAAPCPGLAPAPYVYAPQVAQVLAPVVETFGARTVRDIYVIAGLLPAILFLLWFALIKPFPGVAQPYRWLAFVALSPMTFACANIGIVMHTAVLLSLLTKRRWVFVAAVLACVYLKPTFLGYLLILLMQDRPWRSCLRDFIVAAGLGVIVAGLMWLDAGAGAAAWVAALHGVAVQDQPGLGWFALTDWISIAAGTPLSLGLALGFVAVMAASAIVIARRGGWSADERLALGMGLAALMTPRLMDYDMVLIPLAAALLISRSRSAVLSWLFVLPLALGIAANLLHAKWYHRTHVAMFVFSVLTVAMAAKMAMPWLKSFVSAHFSALKPLRRGANPLR